jgi:hypothetical protein
MLAAIALVLLSTNPAPAGFSPARDFDGSQIAASYSCSPRKLCGAIGSCDEARWYLKNCSWGPKLDGDRDGVPCEKICGGN